MNSSRNSQDNSQIQSEPQTLFNSIRILFNDVQEKFFKIAKPYIEEAIVILGNSGSGKTTLYHILNDPTKLKVDLIDSKFKFANVNSQDNAKIGNKSYSQTLQPNIIVAKIQLQKQKHQIYVIDCPGSGDSDGSQQDIINAYLVMTVFKLFKRVRILLCVPNYACIDAQKFNILFDSFKIIFSNFVVSQSNRTQIIKATSLVLSQVNKQILISTVISIFKKFLQDSSSSSSSRKKYFNDIKLLQNIIDNQRLYLIPKPQSLQDQFYLKLGPYIMQKQIMSKQKFKINHQKDLKFQLSQSQLIKQMYKKLVDRFKQPIEILNLGSYEIIQNMEKQQQFEKTYEFHVKLEEFCAKKENKIYSFKQNKQYYSLRDQRYRKLFNNKRNNFEKITLKQIDIDECEKPFVQIQFRRKILQKNKQLQEDIQKIKQVQQKKIELEKKGKAQKLIEFIKKTFKRQVYKHSNNNQISYFLLLAQYLEYFTNKIYNYSFFQNKDNRQINSNQNFINQQKQQFYNFIDFAYILSRYLLELEIIQSLSSKLQKNYLDLLNILVLDEKRVANSEKKYLLNCKMEQKPTLKYLDLFQKVISQINISDNSQDLMEQQKKINSNDLKFRRDQLNIQINWKRGIKLSQTKRNRQAFQKCQIARKFYEQLHQQKNKDRYIVVNTNFYVVLGNMAMVLKQYDLAIQYFKVIEYQNSIRKCFQEKKIQNSLRIKNVCNIQVEFAYYLASLLEFDQAIKNLTKFIETLNPLNDEHNECAKELKILRAKFRQKQFRLTCEQQVQKRQKTQKIDCRPNQQRIAQLAKINDNRQIKLKDKKQNIKSFQSNTNLEKNNSRCNKSKKMGGSSFLDSFPKKKLKDNDSDVIQVEPESKLS